jgi:hypothetical protein
MTKRRVKPTKGQGERFLRSTLALLAACLLER